MGTRFEAGHLGSVGISPSGMGMRAADVFGNVIHDTSGLIAVVGVLGYATAQTDSKTGNGAWQTVSGTSISFSLSRQGIIYVSTSINALDTVVGDTGYNLYTGVLIDGVFNANYGPQVWLNQASQGSPQAMAKLAAGSHTAALGIWMTSGKGPWSTTGQGGYIYVFEYGE